MMRLLLLTDRSQARSGLVEVLQAAVAGGACDILLREKDLPRSERVELARAIQELLAPVPDGRLFVASDVGLAREVGAAGVHLAAADPRPEPDELGIGPRRDQRLLVGRSCHSEEELRAAADHGTDYVTLSPVFPTASKPGYGPALGVNGLARLCRSFPDLPIVALGGIGPAEVGPCLEAGAAGVAVMGTVMRAEDPSAEVAALLSS